MDTTDVLTISELLSFTDHEVVVDPVAEAAFCASVAQWESTLGVDRSRHAIMWGDEQNYYELTAAASTVFSTTLAAGRTISEMVFRLLNPSKSLIVGFPYFMAKLLIANNRSFDIANTIHLGYFEEHVDVSAYNYGVVKMQDIHDNNGLGAYDMVFAQLPSIAHDMTLIENLYGAVNDGGALVLHSSHDQSNVFIHGDMHPYAEIFTALSTLDGAYVYQVPVGLGITVVTKS